MSPIGVHAPEQWHGAPLRADKRHFVVKFSNFWTVETPPGVSLYFGHPFNREDLPFRSLSGIVDTDTFTRGFIHFPAIWIDPDFEGTLERGTPVAQAVPSGARNWRWISANWTRPALPSRSSSRKASPRIPRSTGASTARTAPAARPPRQLGFLGS